MEFLIIYLLGFIVSIITLFLHNRYSCERLPLGTAIAFSSFSWVWVLIYLLFLLSLFASRLESTISTIEKLNNWFKTGGKDKIC